MSEIIFYIIGYFISLILMHLFHKQLGLDYNQPETYTDYDDWSNNAQAFAGISTCWPIFWTFVFFDFISKKIVKISKYLENKLKDKIEK